jgi:ribosomal protein S18 acetylase RimI-like enzyme
MNISTRTALADEKPAIWRLYESAMKHHIEAIWGWDAAWQIADFDKAFAASSTYVVEVDGRFAGYVQVDIGPVENYLRMIVLVSECRSTGIGARLLAEILHISRHGGRNLHLRVFRTNLAAKRFYEREGWSVAGDDGDFFLMRHKTGRSATTFNPSHEQAAKDFEICTTLD